MKKVYVPTDDELYLMQDMGVNVYKYLLVKAIESLTVSGVNYSNKGMLKSAFKYLRENPDIAYAICRMFPEEIKYSEIAQNDIELCNNLITRDNSRGMEIYSLDNLAYFEGSAGLYSNRTIVQNTINSLARNLPLHPEYRFMYKENQLLDKIFARELLDYSCDDALISIEPAYALTIGDDTRSVIPDLKDILIKGINSYADRYGISMITGSEYFGKDIIGNPDTNVKQLRRCINENR